MSGTNQYSVRPWALVSTVTPPIVAVFSMLLAAAGALEAGAAALEVPELVELVELPQAVIISAASPAGARGPSARAWRTS